MPVDDDAREFGQHFKQGGWRLGLLVARNVEPHKGQGKPRPPVDEAASPVADEKPSKVSGTEFAAKAGVSKQCVAYYYKAWQLAADEGKGAKGLESHWNQVRLRLRQQVHER
jgi:hypothetical protein